LGGGEGSISIPDGCKMYFILNYGKMCTYVYKCLLQMYMCTRVHFFICSCVFISTFTC
jgi:hypothetical protein